MGYKRPKPARGASTSRLNFQDLMSEPEKVARPEARPEPRPEARIAKGFRDITAGELDARTRMIVKIRNCYERYGFEPLETPAIEYTGALGKFLPDQDRPNAGVFSFADEDGEWMSLRYDLTAPLARYVAQNFQSLPKPFRRYAYGPVYRNEKPGPGRFRQFWQFDADTVGSDSPAADAEMCMLAADTLEALGVKRGRYVIKINDRRILDAVMEAAGLGGSEHASKRLTVLRAIDKLDRLGLDGVRQLLGPGRKDESGDFTKGAGLDSGQASKILDYLANPMPQSGLRGAEDLQTILSLCRAGGFGEDQIRADQTVVRGLEYYTGPVFEAELTFETKDENGNAIRFGSVGGGGRYDDLVARFTGERVPATGFSIGVSRLQAALALVEGGVEKRTGPVVVLVMDRDQIAQYQKLVQQLRSAGIRAEMYLGASGMKAQMKYADKRNSPCVVIQGSDERAKGEVMIKDLIEGAKAAAAIQSNKDWKAARPAQFAVPEAMLIEHVKDVISRHQTQSASGKSV